jgi:hypothetical protein
VQTGLVALSLASLVFAYFAVCFIYVFVYSPGLWVGGMLVGTVSRAMYGGPYYDGAGSLLGPTWPYFPLAPLLTHALARLGVPLLVLPSVLGGLSFALLPIASAWFSRNLRAGWLPSLVTSFVLYGLFVPRYHTFELIAAGFFPDACVPLFSILACAMLAKIEQSGLTWVKAVVFGLFLVAACLSKQAGAAAIAGSVVYLLVFSRMAKPARYRTLGVAVAAGLVCMAVVFGIPHCFEVTVRVMSHHPKDWERTKVVWEHLFTNQLSGVLLCLIGASAGLSSRPEARRGTLHLCCVLVIAVAVQVLASVKDGGGGENDSYNMELALSLVVPLAAWAWASFLGRTRAWGATAVMLVACAFCTKALQGTHKDFWKRREDSWKAVTDGAKELSALGIQGGVFGPPDVYWYVYKAGYSVDTTCTAIWHYALVDPQVHDPAWLRGVRQALSYRRYALISPRWSESLPDEVKKQLGEDIMANYQALPGSQWWGRKPR